MSHFCVVESEHLLALDGTVATLALAEVLAFLQCRLLDVFQDTPGAHGNVFAESGLFAGCKQLAMAASALRVTTTYRCTRSTYPRRGAPITEQGSGPASAAIVTSPENGQVDRHTL